MTRFPAARRAYAEVLVKAQLAILPLPLGCYWPSKSEHPLVERVAMLKRSGVSRARRSAGAAALAVLCASGGVAAWAAQPADLRFIAPKPARAAAGEGPSTHAVAPTRAPTGAEAGPPDQTPSEAAAITVAQNDVSPAPPPPLEAVAPAAQRTQASPGTQDAVRRWIAKTQLHQPDEEDMSPALVQAARPQQMMTMQVISAFGPLQDIRFVRVTAAGEDAFEADFAHGKLEVLAGPLTLDGKLDQLRWRPIWAKDGAPPEPGAPMPPVASLEVSKPRAIRVSDPAPETGQPLGPGRYVERSGLKASAGCNRQGGGAPSDWAEWRTLSTARSPPAMP